MSVQLVLSSAWNEEATIKVTIYGRLAAASSWVASYCCRLGAKEDARSVPSAGMPGNS